MASAGRARSDFTHARNFDGCAIVMIPLTQFTKPYMLAITRHDKDEDGKPQPLTVLYSDHEDIRAAMDALYDHILLLTKNGFASTRIDLTHWSAVREDVVMGEQIELDVFIHYEPAEVVETETPAWTSITFTSN